jgi:hypothetical protein
VLAVERHGGGVVREDVEHDLGRARVASPGHAGLEERRPDPAAAVRGVDQHAQLRPAASQEEREPNRRRAGPFLGEE